MPSHVGQVIMTTTLDTAAKVKAIYGGTWEAWGKGKVPVGVDPNDSDFNAPNKSGGAKTVTLTEAQMPKHNHGGSTSTESAYNTSAIYAPGGSTNLYALNWNGSFVGNDNAYRNRTKHSHTINNAGEDEAHENMPPFVTLYMWQRTS